MRFNICPLYPVLDAAWLPGCGSARQDGARRLVLEQAAHALAAAGVTLLQYRNKQEDDAQMLRDAAFLRQHAPASLRIVLNDRVHLVAEAGCDGAHVGQGDMAADDARAILGQERILGLSAHTEAELLAADASPADYIAVGPVYATGSKADAEPIVGLAGVRRARVLTVKPLVAIGGITFARAAEVRAAGADSVAVISALFGSRPTQDDSLDLASLQKLAGDFLRVFR